MQSTLEILREDLRQWFSNAVLVPAASTSPENLLETQILWSQLELLLSETLGLELCHLFFNKPYR